MHFESVPLVADSSRTILRENPSRDLYYRWTVNPYRGCSAACAFCCARNSHKYLERDPGAEFDNTIVIKPNAALLLRDAFERDSWRGDTITFSGVTDPYQAAEETERLTRQCLEVCLAYRNPVRIVSKMSLIERDLDLLTALHTEARCEVEISLAFDDATAALLEPRAPSTTRRLQTMATLTAAGLSVGIMAAPVILGLNDSQLPTLLEQACAAGASRATWTAARIPPDMAQVFLDRLRAAMPERAEKILHLLRDSRAPKSSGEFHDRDEAVGPYALAVDASLRATCQRLGLEMRGYRKWTDPPTVFRRPRAQLTLW